MSASKVVIVLAVAAIFAVGAALVWYLAFGRTVEVRLAFQPVSPTGIFIDGEPVFPGPEGVIQVAEGRHVLEAVAPGYQPFKDTIAVLGEARNAFAFTLMPMPGLLFVTAPVEGASVLIDGEAAGVTPLREYEIPAGTYTVRVDAGPDFIPFETKAEIAGRRQAVTVEADLRRSWGWVTFETNPPGARLLVPRTDNPGLFEYVARTPVRRKLPAGEYTWKCDLGSEYEPWEHRFVVAADQDQTLPPHEFKLRPGVLAISSQPAGAAIWVGGRLAEAATPAEVNVPGGNAVTVKLVQAGYKPAAFEVTLKPGEKASRHVNLDTQTGRVEIASEPADAEVIIGGISQGRTPLTLELPVREQLITVQRTRHQPATFKVLPLADARVAKRVVLVEEGATRAAPALEPAMLPKTWQAAGGILMVRVVPQGEFLMGSPVSDPARDSNEAQVRVVLSEAFYVAEAEITNAQYKLAEPGHDSGMLEGRPLHVSDMPVVNVTWAQAAAFCNWLSRQHGLPEVYNAAGPGEFQAASPPPAGFRLLTEAEFEYINRFDSPDYAPFPWGKFAPPPNNTANLADEAAGKYAYTLKGYSDGYVVAAPVKSYAANALGIHDLGGNVAEWCHNVFEPAWPGAPSPLVDPMGPKIGAAHSVRGASYRDGSFTAIRTAYRRYARDKAPYIGFRVMIPARGVAAVLGPGTATASK